MIHIDQIAKAITAYLEREPGDADRLAPLVAALGEPTDITSRETFTGHVTCSAIVLDPDRRVLHIRHNALNRWLCPGGHLEPGDTSLAEAARREAVEETGIPAGELYLVDDVPVDIDVHPIPASAAKGEPEHQHFDLRFVFTTDGDAQVALQAEEVHDFAWLPFGEFHLRDRVGSLLAPSGVAGGREK